MGGSVWSRNCFAAAAAAAAATGEGTAPGSTGRSGSTRRADPENEPMSATSGMPAPGWGAGERCDLGREPDRGLAGRTGRAAVCILDGCNEPPRRTPLQGQNPAANMACCRTHYDRWCEEQRTRRAAEEAGTREGRSTEGTQREARPWYNEGAADHLVRHGDAVRFGVAGGAAVAMGSERLWSVPELSTVPSGLEYHYCYVEHTARTTPCGHERCQQLHPQAHRLLPGHDTTSGRPRSSDQEGAAAGSAPEVAAESLSRCGPRAAAAAATQLLWTIGTMEPRDDIDYWQCAVCDGFGHPGEAFCQWCLEVRRPQPAGPHRHPAEADAAPGTLRNVAADQNGSVVAE